MSRTPKAKKSARARDDAGQFVNRASAPATRMLTMRITDEEHTAWSGVAAGAGVTLSEWIRQTLSRAVVRAQTKKPGGKP